MRTTRPFLRAASSFLTLALMSLAGSPSAASPPDVLHRGELTVMTWNVYFGFDERPLLGATPDQIPGLVDEAWQAIHATDFRLRARDIARRIVETRPDLVALQEAARYELLDVSSGTPEAVEVIDFVEILLGELEDARHPYVLKVVAEGTDVMLPDTAGQFVRLLDRDVILAAGRHGPPDLRISNPQHANFSNLLTICLAPDTGSPDGCAMPLTVKRGWASVDVAGRSGSFRFVTTHLEDVTPDSPPELQQLQLAQAAELLELPLKTPMRAVLVGDFNSDAHASWPVYAFLTGSPRAGAGLTDVWPVARPMDPGLTWGQSPDLLNPFPTFTQRLDLVLLKGRFRILESRLVGDRRADRMPNGFWPSDHAGVVATLAP
jgi:endonuclease/exonuclease/phosphatase family metal-dependent hydrolase